MLTVIKSTAGYIFGGHASFSWTSCDNYKSDNESFVYTLTNPSNRPLKLMNKGDQYSIRDYSDLGRSFGQYGQDLHVSDNSNLNANSFSF